MSKELRAGREALETLWRQGLSGQALLGRHSQLVDSFIVKCFQDNHEIGIDMAFVALGGYGRQELFPYSDIDLMLLYAPNAAKRLDQMTACVFYPLWDAGLEVGHAVRTVKDCLNDAGNDFFFQVAMLDVRLLVGSEALFTTLLRKYRLKYVEGRRKVFLNDMQNHRKMRHRRFDQHGYLLEPHIKDSRGGLRDVQTILWTGKVVFGFKGFTDLEDSGLLSHKEHNNFEKAWNQLIRIRNRLHYISRRKNDQLYFEHQEDMAQAFDYKTDGDLLGVERFMRDVYGRLQNVAVIADLFFEHVDEVLGKSSVGKNYKELEPGLEARGGRLHFTDQNLLENRPLLLMRIFFQMAKSGLPLHHRTRKMVSSHLHLVDDHMRRSRRMAKAFMEILTETSKPEMVLSTLLETGFLGAYIPEFGAIESLAQHDVYHVYTVDMHLLQCVAELHVLCLEEKEKFASLSAPQILFLAALLHDIGKGQGKDHCEYGAELAIVIGKRLGLADDELTSLAFLIKHHLFLTNTALRRDLEDETFILRCARLIKDPDRLKMLYLLSIADARATGSEVWTKWKGALLLELYLKIVHLLDSSDLVDPDRIQGVDWMRSKIRQLLDGKKEKVIEVLPEDYLLNFSPEQVMQHIRLREELFSCNCVVRNEQKNGYWSILLMARDRTGLLAKICGTLALHNLNVLNAQIFTWGDGTAVDIIDVISWTDMPFDDQDWEGLTRDINLALGGQLGLEHRLMRKSFPVLGNRKISLRPANKVEINNQASDFYTIIEVYADDRVNLLYDITRTLADFNLAIFRAKIATKIDQLVDVFYVQDEQGGKIINSTLQKELRQSLLFTANKAREAKNK